MTRNDVLSCPNCSEKVLLEEEPEQKFNVVCPNCKVKFHYKKEHVMVYRTEIADPFHRLKELIKYSMREEECNRKLLTDLTTHYEIEKEHRENIISRFIAWNEFYTNLLRNLKIRPLAEGIPYLQRIIEQKDYPEDIFGLTLTNILNLMLEKHQREE